MSLSAFSTIIWDWNGTLINDISLCVELVSEELESHGLPRVDFDTYRRAYRHPMREMYAELGLELDEPSFSSMAVKWLEKYEMRRVDCGLHQGVTEALKAISESNRKQAILSAHRNDLVLAAVQDHSIEEHFIKIVGLDKEGGHGKIDKGHELLKTLETRPEQVLIIGDSVHDYEVADALGISCHLLAQGGDHSEKLKNTGCPVYETFFDWAKDNSVF